MLEKERAQKKRMIIWRGDGGRDWAPDSVQSSQDEEQGYRRK